LGTKRFSVSMSGVTTADKLIAVLNGAPTAGCELLNAYVTATNTVSIGIVVPVLGIGATYSVPVSVYKITG